MAYFTGLARIYGTAKGASYPSGAFSFCDNLSNISIPESVKSIGGAAFAYCTSLNMVLDLPNLEEILDAVFYKSGITSIKSLGKVVSFPFTNGYLDGSWKNLGVFSYCVNLSEATLPKSLKSIGSYAFMGCTNLRTVVFEENNVENINSYAFAETGYQGDVNYPNLKTIGYSAFYATDVTSVTNLGDISEITSSNGTSSGAYGWQFYGAFSYCKQLHTVVLPKSLTKIGNGSFLADDALVNINLTECTSLESVGAAAFNGCANLSMSFSEINKLKSIGSAAFAGCKKVTGTVNLPYLEAIAERAFVETDIEHVVDLGNITSFPRNNSVGVNGVWGPGAFALCPNLKSIVIPSTISVIPGNFLTKSTSIAAIILKSGTPCTLESGAFSNTNSTFFIYVPDGAVGVYQTATNWNAFASRIKPMSEYIA